MNQIIYRISDVYLDNIHTSISTILWISYIILHFYYLYYLKHIKCSCYNLTYRTFIIILICTIAQSIHVNTSVVEDINSAKVE